MDVRSFLGRADGIEGIAAEVASHWGGLSRPKLIAFRENLVFAAEAPAGRVVVRVHRPGYQSEDTIRSELWYMAALAEAGLPVPDPLRTAGGEMVARLSNGLVASTMTWLDGVVLEASPHRQSGDADALALIYANLGELLARVHETSARLQRPSWFVRPRWQRDDLVGAAPVWGRFWEHANLTADEAAVLGEARTYLTEKLKSFEGDLSCACLIHADVLRENVMCRGTDVALIDFDDCGFGFRHYDLGIVLMQNTGDAALRPFVNQLVDGYARVSPVTPRHVEMIEVFALARALVSVGWTSTRLPQTDRRNRRYIERATAMARTVLAGRRLF